MDPGKRISEYIRGGITSSVLGPGESWPNVNSRMTVVHQ